MGGCEKRHPACLCKGYVGRIDAWTASERQKRDV